MLHSAKLMLQCFPLTLLPILKFSWTTGLNLDNLNFYYLVLSSGKFSPLTEHFEIYLKSARLMPFELPELYNYRCYLRQRKAYNRTSSIWSINHCQWKCFFFLPWNRNLGQLLAAGDTVHYKIYKERSTEKQNHETKHEYYEKIFTYNPRIQIDCTFCWEIIKWQDSELNKVFRIKWFANMENTLD